MADKDKDNPQRAADVGGYPVPPPSGGPDGELRELKHARGTAAARGDDTDEYDEEVVRVLDENRRGPRATEELNDELARADKERREAAEKRRQGTSTSDARTSTPAGRTATPQRSTTDATGSTSDKGTSSSSTSDKGSSSSSSKGTAK